MHFKTKVVEAILNEIEYKISEKLKEELELCIFDDGGPIYFKHSLALWIDLISFIRSKPSNKDSVEMMKIYDLVYLLTATPPKIDECVDPKCKEEGCKVHQPINKWCPSTAIFYGKRGLLPSLLNNSKDGEDNLNKLKSTVATEYNS